MFSLFAREVHSNRRRGAVAVFVVMLLPVLIGFAALTVDVGYLYNVRADLQNAADAGAMAAATAMMRADFNTDPIAAARNAASDMVSKNPVLGRALQLDLSRDVQPGRANFDAAANRYNFTASTVLPDSVKVTVRYTADSPNGAVPLFFAAIFGKHVTNISAEAVAAVAPRDIAIAADTSGSLRFDSLLYFYRTRQVNTYDVWNALPGGALEAQSTWTPEETPADLSQAAGPGWGYFKQLAYGTDVTSNAYDVTTDPGLVRLPYRANWNDAQLRANLTARGYSDNEVNTIMAQNGENDSQFIARTAVAMGLADWNSGQGGGLWSTQNGALGSPGNGNNFIGSGEVRWKETALGSNLSDSAAVWQQYIAFMTSRNRSDFQYRFGIKTFTDYLVYQRNRSSETPELAAAPLQPLQSIKDGVNLLAGMLSSLQSADQVSLESFSSRATHQMNLTDNYAALAARFDAIQPDGGTNIGAGMQLATNELQSSRARAASRKVMVVLTDGYANYDRYGNYSPSGARAYALSEAQRAASAGIEILTIAVGQAADEQLMRDIAATGNGTYFHAAGTPAEYTAQLQNIFGQIGGRRSVELIQ